MAKKKTYTGNDTSKCKGAVRHGKRTKAWRLVGGGCAIGSSKRAPCDDIYENVSTGDEVIARTTKCRHFSMPLSVDAPSDIKRLKGVYAVSRQGKKRKARRKK